MEPVTQRVNLLRGIGVVAINARKTHCIYGHAFTSINTYITKTGARHCRSCGRRRDRQRRR
jgi:hypothetical protein